jgi:hypothetical protein
LSVHTTEEWGQERLVCTAKSARVIVLGSD